MADEAKACSTHACPGCLAERADGLPTSRHTVGGNEALPRAYLEHVADTWAGRGSSIEARTGVRLLA